MNAEARNTNLFVTLFFLILIASCTTSAPSTPAIAPTDQPTEEATLTPLPSMEGAEFPTGLFEASDGRVSIEFRDDGSCRLFSKPERWEVPCRYGVNGDVYAEMMFNYPGIRKIPGTYYWSYDGENLIFQLRGEDPVYDRQKSYLYSTYQFSSEVESLPEVDEIEFPTGRFISDDGTRGLEFDEDGKWRYFEGDLSVPSGSGLYVTNGNLYTEMTHDYPDDPDVPVTYEWTFDGKNLTFDLWGEDVIDHRRDRYDGRTYQIEG